MLAGPAILVAACILAYLNHVVPDPYMDEIFHIPQTQSYLNGNFSHWDPKITTPPALYLVGMVSAYVPTEVWGLPPVLVLRSINSVLHVLTLVLLTNWLHPFAPAAYVVYSLPVLYFCSFVYYTDVLSTLLVLLSLFLVMGAHNYGSRTCLHLSAVLSGMAVLTRQTNILWAFFNLGVYVLLTTRSIKNQEPAARPALRTVVTDGIAVVFTSGLSYVVVGSLFLAFLAINGTIVLGDKSNHQLCLHLAQLVYFFSFFVFFAPGYALKVAWACLRDRNMLMHCIKFAAPWAVLATLFVTYSSHAHIFVLSDNRHYPFYLWRRVFSTPLKYYLVVPSSCVGFAVATVCLQGFSPLFRVLYLFCLVASLVTSPLIEFRYYIIPFALLYVFPLVRRPRANELVFRRKSHVVNLLWNCVINAAVLYLFLFRPFVAPDGSVGRFMW